MKYICNNCGYVYNEDIEEIKLKHLHKSWKCPICFMSKELFTDYDEDDDFYLI